ncbi:hypothetical protein OIE67_16085 [Nonomuraea fuscirosea]|uniref:WD40 repeat domain-containing protein n=1 Tax=Nonomuraea fuscirosea TaxID=1291556 RepID=UPI002DD9016E|nr:hypothetical protein [Nonomuraea fuscirosea]WSA56061.1 hypothetical protein OIE67_16085 [Nonomuraea fuscirosea]
MRKLRSTQSVNAVAFSSDGKLLAVGSGGNQDNQGQMRLWDPATRQPVGDPMASTRSVDAVAFSPDGKLLASSGYFEEQGGDYSVRLWDPATQQLVGDPPNLDNTGEFTAVVFTADGKALVCGGRPAKSFFRSSGDDDGIVRLEDLGSWPGRTVPR